MTQQMNIRFLFLLAAMTAMVSCNSQKKPKLEEGLYADMVTNKGTITLQLYYDTTPLTVANFVSLAEGKSPFVTDTVTAIDNSGKPVTLTGYKKKKYYDGVSFHRVMKDFMIQGGDPTATGRGNPGYLFKDEFVDTLRHAEKGVLSMANSGPNSNGSQFFITHKATPWLDGVHSIFGKVIHGIEVVDTIASVKTDAANKPLEEVVIEKINIIRNGKRAKQFDAITIMREYFKEEKRKVEERNKMLKVMATQFEEDRLKAITLESGLQIFKVKEGNGEKPKIGQSVGVNYAGYFLNGDLFDSCIKEVAEKYGKYDIKRDQAGMYGPTTMRYSPDAQLIAGFKEALQTMKVGDKIRVFIPPHLGYGENNYGPIPGGSTLVFDLEIADIK